MTLTYACAIAPLDQSTTSIGWHPGFYQRMPCGLTDCNWWDPTLQFLADPGAPVVAPFPMTVISLNPFLLRADLPWTDTYGRVSHWGTPGLGQVYPIRIRGVTPAVVAGAQLAKGDLIGRIAPRERGAKWSFWDSAPSLTDPRGHDNDGIVDLFHDVGLDIVGAVTDQYVRGFDRVPSFGGRLLARSSGPAGAACAPPSAVHGLGHFERLFLGSAAPAGYVDPSTGPYARYGTSTQADASPPNPSHENVHTAVAVGGGGLALAAVAALGLWWYARR